MKHEGEERRRRSRTLAMAGIGPGFQHRSRFDGYVMGVIGVEAKAILFTGAVTKFLEPGADPLSPLPLYACYVLTYGLVTNS